MSAAEVGNGGTVEKGFDAVRTAFHSNFTERGDVGAAVSVYHQGRPVVDIWGGEARPGVRWEQDTLTSVFSTTKGATTVVVALLVDRGQIDLAEPIASYWPEFGAGGKDTITLGDVLSHRSGVITFPDYQELLALPSAWGAMDEIAERIAAAAPMWQPGTRHGYHALTLGWIAGEVVRRVTGRSLGSVFREEVAAPLGLDFWIGLPAEHHERVANLIDAPDPDDPGVAAYIALFSPSTWTGKAHFVGRAAFLVQPRRSTPPRCEPPRSQPGEA